MESLYPLYQRQLGIHIVDVEEQLRTKIATKEDAKRLEISAGTPLLRVDQVALTIDKKRVEWCFRLFDTFPLSITGSRQCPRHELKFDLTLASWHRGLWTAFGTIK